MRSVNVLTMVLAGGVGERLYPLTAHRSKPSVPFAGNFRIIDFTLMNCVLSGLRRIHVLTQYQSLSLGRHRSRRWNFLSTELGEFLELVPPKMRTKTGFYQGTADAIYRNLDLLDRSRPDVVLVLSGDHIYRADYSRFLQSHLDSDAEVTVMTESVPAEEASSFGVLRVGAKGEIQQFIEKPADPSPYAIDGRCLVNLGVYCFQTTFLVERLVKDSKQNTAHDFGKNILPGSLDLGSVLTCPLEAVCPDDQPYWRDVGTIDSYFQANMDLLETPARFRLRDRRWPEGSRFHEWLPSVVTMRTTIGGKTVLGKNLVSSGVVLEDARLARTVLAPDVHVGRGSEVFESILFSGVKIGADCQLHRVIVEEGVEIPPGTRIETGGDSREFTTSEGGVTVVSAGHRFDQPAPEARGYERKEVRPRYAARPPQPAEDESPSPHHTTGVG